MYFQVSTECVSEFLKISMLAFLYSGFSPSIRISAMKPEKIYVHSSMQKYMKGYLFLLALLLLNTKCFHK